MKKENATKYDYDAEAKQWSETKIKIQILDESFAEGSMRQEEFLIKIQNLTFAHQWAIILCAPEAADSPSL